MRSPHRSLTFASVLASFLAVTSCGQGGAAPAGSVAAAGSTAQSQPTQPATQTEHAAPVPYLTVATDKGVSVIRQEDMTRVADIAESAQPSLTGLSDGRHVMLTYTKENRAAVLDSGSYAQAHGDHAHYFTRPPALIGYKPVGTKPVHVVSNEGRTAIFFDGDGAATVFADADLTGGEVKSSTVDSGPHHGVIVPLADDSTIVSMPREGSGLPDSLQHRDPKGGVKGTFTCAGMHGEVVRANVAAFGCKDSVLLVVNGKAKALPYPDKSGERVGGITADDEGTTFLGDYGPDTLVLVRGGRLAVVPAGVEYGPRELLHEGGFVLVGTDGSLRVFDETGAPRRQFPAIDAWKASEDHSAAKPGLAVVGHTACVSDPAHGKVVCVDTKTGDRKELGGLDNPTALVATNAEGGHRHRH